MRRRENEEKGGGGEGGIGKERRGSGGVYAPTRSCSAGCRTQPSKRANKRRKREGRVSERADLQRGSCLRSRSSTHLPRALLPAETVGRIILVPVLLLLDNLDDRLGRPRPLRRSSYRRLVLLRLLEPRLLGRRRRKVGCWYLGWREVLLLEVGRGGSGGLSGVEEGGGDGGGEGGRCGGRVEGVETAFCEGEDARRVRSKAETRTEGERTRRD